MSDDRSLDHPPQDQEARQDLDDLTVLSDVGPADMGVARLNIARGIDVDDARLGSLATIHQGGSDGTAKDTGAFQTDQWVAGAQIGETADRPLVTVSDQGRLPVREQEQSGSASPTRFAPASGKTDLSTENVVFGDPLASQADPSPHSAQPETEFLEFGPQPTVDGIARTAAPEPTANSAPQFRGLLVDDPATQDRIDLSSQPALQGKEDEPLSFAIDATDPDGDELAFTFSDPAHGTISRDPRTGLYVFTPDKDWHGTDAFTVTVRDNYGNTTSQRIEVSVSPVADEAVFGEMETATGFEDGLVPMRIDVTVARFETLAHLTLGGDQVPPGSALFLGGRLIHPGEDGNWTLLEADIAGNATMVEGADGSVTYEIGGLSIQPPADWNGAFSLNLTATTQDGETFATSSQLLGVSVEAVNDAPSAATPDILAGTEDTAFLISSEQLLQGASDIDGDHLSVANLRADGGSIVDNGDGTWTFTPASNYSGTLTLHYDVVDGNGGVTPSEAEIDITGVADAAELSVSLGAPERVVDTTIGGYTSAPLTGDLGAAAVKLNLTTMSGSLDEHGFQVMRIYNPNGHDVAVSWNMPGTSGHPLVAGPGYTYFSVPDAQSGTVRLVADGIQQSVKAFTAVGAPYQPLTGMQVEINIDARLTDTDGSETLQIKVEGVPAGGVLSSGTPNADGSWSIPADQLAGLTMTVPDSHAALSLTVSAVTTETNGHSTAISSTVQIPGMNDAPVVTQVVGGTGLESTTGAATTVTGRIVAGDLDGDKLTYAVLDDGIEVHNGSLTVDASGNFIFLAKDENWHGSDNFVIRVSDGYGGSVDQTVTITVTPTNDAPTVVPLSDQSATERQPFAFDAGASFADVDAGDVLTFSARLLDANGGEHDLPAWMQFDPTTGRFSGTPGGDAQGTFSVKVTATDGAGAKVSDVFDLNVADGSETVPHPAPTLTASIGLGAATTIFRTESVTTTNRMWSTDPDGRFGDGSQTMSLRAASHKDGHPADFDIKVNGVVVGHGVATSETMGTVNVSLTPGFRFADGQKLEIVDKGGAGNLYIDKLTINGKTIEAETGIGVGGVNHESTGVVKIASGSLVFGSIDDGDSSWITTTTTSTHQVADRVDHPLALDFDGNTVALGSVTIGNLPPGSTLTFGGQTMDVPESGALTLDASQARSIDEYGAVLSVEPGTAVEAPTVTLSLSEPISASETTDFESELYFTDDSSAGWTDPVDFADPALMAADQGGWTIAVDRADFHAANVAADQDEPMIFGLDDDHRVAFETVEMARW